MTERTVKVPAVSCSHCVRAIVVELEDLPGVAAVEGDPESKLLTVRFEPPATWEAIVRAMAEIGYPPEATP